MVDAYELELFDDVAQLFFQHQVQIQDRNEAEQLQQELLRKMPMHTGTQIRQMDLGEWSIFWNFYDQSLNIMSAVMGYFMPMSTVSARNTVRKSEPIFNRHVMLKQLNA